MSVSEAVDADLVWSDDLPATLLETIAALRTSASTTPGDPTAAIADLDLAIADGSDQMAAIAAVHALAAFPGAEPGERLAALLYQEGAFLREHAAWALGSRSPVTAALPGLVDLVLDGGFAGTLAQATLEAFAAQDSGLVRDALVTAVPYATLEGSRSRLVETLGLVPGVVTTRILLDLAADDRELPAVQAAALAALGDVADPSDPQVHAVLDAVDGTDGPLAGVARLARTDLDRRRSPRAGRARREGLTVAQLFLHADIDRDLRRAGPGDNGGIATLLVRLGDALARATEPRAAGAHHLPRPGRRRPGRLESATAPVTTTCRCPSRGRRCPPAEAWPLRVAARRGDPAHPATGPGRRAAPAHGRGRRLAAAEVARELGIPVVFTLAPDPHAVGRVREADGALTRANFGPVDEVEHYWFRIRLVRQMAAATRPSSSSSRGRTSQATCGTCSASTSTREPGRFTVVPEGIDLGAARPRRPREVPAAARGEMRRPPRSTPSTTLDDLLLTLPPERAGCRWRSASGGCTGSRAWRPSSRPGPAIPSSPSDATC